MLRFILALAAASLLGAAQPGPPKAATPVSAVPMPVTNPYADNNCPETPMSLARKQGERLGPRKLGDLPPAQTFMAVDRRVGGCAAPMTMSEARTAR